MRREIVPVDTASEQKVIFGLVSMRQLIYVFVGIVAAYNMSALFGIPYFSLGIRFIIFMVFFSPIAVGVFFLGFWKNEKFDMYWDQFLLNKVMFHIKRKSHRYRHGR
ncbi:PrgI family mobile element protein [Brevibacillus sp. NPDC003359]